MMVASQALAAVAIFGLAYADTAISLGFFCALRARVGVFVA